MTDFPRLIEHAFPLKQASLDSVHEKNVRHGHISTLHIWPARRPLAACRAALLATLLPDPSAEPKPDGMSEEAWQKEIARRRRELCEKIGGRLVRKIEKKKMPGGRTVEREKFETVGGVLHWHGEPKTREEQETVRQQREDLEWFRQEIRRVYGRPPRVLDPFAGGGAIPLEAMRLGCEATAVDINPVAWFILKCTLEYPQKLAGQTRPLPEFILHNDAFMRQFFAKAKGYGKAETAAALKRVHERLRKKVREEQEEKEPGLPFAPATGSEDGELEADLAWHVRAWGQWVLDRARRDLAKYYPVYADFEPLKPGHKAYEKQPMRLVPLREAGTEACPTLVPDIDALNAEFTKGYVEDKRNPRWVAKPTVAYLWARTVTCKNCRATVPLLKTRWLCKKDRKRVLLTMEVKDVEQASVPAADPGHRRKLPRLRRTGAAYFITWRLNSNQRELEPPERDLVAQALKHFDGQRYDLSGWVVMNDHVHVVVHPAESYTLSQITHSWKSFTANQLQKLHGRRGAVWQDESWDRIIRHEGEFLEKLEYIRTNPARRWPEYEKETYPWMGFELGYSKAGTEACPTNKEGSQGEEGSQGGTGSQGGAGVSACPPSPCPPSAKQIIFGIETDVSLKGGNAAQRREHDKRIGAGTMSRSGAKCPCCGTIMTMEDIRTEGKAGRLGTIATAVVVDGQKGKEYRLPTDHELTIVGQAGGQVSVPGAQASRGKAGTEACPTITQEMIDKVFADIPFGLPTEPTPAGGGTGAGRAFSVQGYGLMKWRDLFTARQLTALGTFVAATRAARMAMPQSDLPSEWSEAIDAGLTIGVDRIADRQSMVCRWDMGYTKLQGTFTRFALPITWDYCEGNPFSETTGNYVSNLEWVAKYTEHAMLAAAESPRPRVKRQSAIESHGNGLDAIITDPPYYDAIPYSDLMDFFYIWLRRALHGSSVDIDQVFAAGLSPKWDHEAGDGELIDDSSRHHNDAVLSKQVYEEGMARVFASCCNALNPDGRLVIVFAHKHPDAWETLVSAIIRAGFVVDGSWPIQTEMGNRTRALSGAALASSVWLVCKKRLAATPVGWDNRVLEQMRSNIAVKLRDFWDAGIRGPDFVWAATGPALEAYSRHPVVRKANQPNAVMTVSEFLTHVRRMVVDYIVGQVLSGRESDDADVAAADKLDEPTAYYLLHRNDFGMEDAPVGTVILYAVSCGLSDRELIGTWDLMAKVGGGGTGVPTGDEDRDEPDADSDEPVEAADSGSKVRLKTWAQRNGRSMGYEAPGGRPVPLIDRVHRLMHLWKAGEMHKVDEYLDDAGLRRHELFKRLLQSLIELSRPGSDERSLLESLSNHVGAKGARRVDPQGVLAYGDDG